MLAKYPSIPYVAPFGIFIVLLGLRDFLPFGAGVEYPLRVIVSGAVLLLLSRSVVSFRASRPLQSVLVGLLVFVVWILPDRLAPGYRDHWLFSNSLLGVPHSSLGPDLRGDLVFLVFRFAGTALLVPVVEELFWRAWLMRYLISPDFRSIPLGGFTAVSFWITALLFASEHGSYWDVGLLAGIAYNWWMVRTGSIGSCILAHGVTNACLAIYVVGTGNWQYWL